MKISKAFGFGILVHVALIAVFIVQPSCMTMQAPTQTYQQSQNSDSLDFGSTDSPLDPAFNSGLDSGSDGSIGLIRPNSEFSEFEGVTPKLSPIISDPASSTVDIAGPSFKIHTVQKGDSLWAISRRYNVSLDELYAANGLNKNSVLKIGQQIKIPVEGSTATISTVTADTYQPSGFNLEAETYTVARGDTLSKIARMFNTSISLIKAANGKNSDVIRVGEKLTIPVNGSASNYVPKSSTSAATSTASKGSAIHVVKMGEYPATIARQYGMTTSELLAMNGITDPKKMQVGQKLKVNRNGSGSGSAPIVETKVQTVPSIDPTKPATVQPEKNRLGAAPVKIRVVEADPLIESGGDEIDPDLIFDDVEEIPVIPFDE